MHWDNMFLKKGDNSAAGVSVPSNYTCCDHDCCIPDWKLPVNMRSNRLWLDSLQEQLPPNFIPMLTHVSVLQVAWSAGCAGPVPQPLDKGPRSTCFQQGRWQYQSACGGEGCGHEYRWCGSWPSSCGTTSAQTRGSGAGHDGHRGQAEGTGQYLTIQVLHIFLPVI